MAWAHHRGHIPILSVAANAVFRLFENLVDGGKTVLMVTHDNDLAARAQITLVIADGEIVDERTNGKLNTIQEGQNDWQCLC